jgi:hypothetical protein
MPNNIIMADEKGKEIVLLGSGTFTTTENLANLDIPIDIAGTPIFATIEAPTIEGVSQTNKWGCAKPPIQDFLDIGFETFGAAKGYTSTGGEQTFRISATLTNTNLIVSRGGSGYPIIPNTYKWNVWGYAK